MKKWEASLAEHAGRLSEWQSGYDREFKRLYKERKPGLFKRLSDADLAQVASDAQAAVGTEYLTELGRFFDELGDFYLEALPHVRGKIRAGIGGNPSLTDFHWQYAVDAVDLIRGPRDTDRLRHALVAISIDDHRVDTHQLNALLGRLWTTAKRAKIDPNPILREVALMSNPGAGGGGAFLQSFLLDFPTSRYFREHVQPQLRAGAA